MRTLSLVTLLFAWSLSPAEPADYETVMETEVDRVGPVLSAIEEELGIQMRSDEIAARAKSLKQGLVVQQTFDMSHRGITFEVIYQIAAIGQGEVSVSFSAYQRKTIEAICLEFFKAGGGTDKEEARKACDLRVPETFRV